MALQPWRDGKIIRIENETAETKRFWIAVPELVSFDFIPGQFVTIDLPIHEKANKRWRSYSIASPPNGSNIFELIIVRDKVGTGTKYIFEEIKVGTVVKFRGPQGVFKLIEPIEKDIFFICTGTGIAPFRSMLHQISHQQIPHKNIYLVFGCRTKDNLLYYQELENMQSSLPGFAYIPVLSREKWAGQMGYVHAVYEKICAGKQPALFYLCGWKEMVDEAKKRIIEMGYDEKAIHTELYG